MRQKNRCQYLTKNPKEVAEMLPQEIITDILLRLPAKSIGRCRCVSKPWRSLLSQPQFIKAHLNRSKQYPGESSLILVSSNLYQTSLSIAHHLFDEITAFAKNLCVAVDPDSWMGGIPSCDGLILVEDQKEINYLMNPTTKEIKELPVSPFSLDPRASFTMYGVGYDSVSDDYKVVTLSYYDSDREHERDCTEMFVSVYSVKNGTWKKAESSPYDHAVGHVTCGVYVGGCIHWLASKTNDYSSVIAGFDLAQETFREVPAPSSVNRDKFVFNQLVLLGGCLCMFYSRRSRESDVWVMKHYGVEESWTKFTIIDPDGAEFRPICMSGEEKVVLVKDEETVVEKLVMYSLDQGTFKDIAVHGIADEFQVGGTFMESLVSPYHRNETRTD